MAKRGGNEDMCGLKEQLAKIDKAVRCPAGESLDMWVSTLQRFWDETQAALGESGVSSVPQMVKKYKRIVDLATTILENTPLPISVAMDGEVARLALEVDTLRGALADSQRRHTEDMHRVDQMRVDRMESMRFVLRGLQAIVNSETLGGEPDGSGNIKGFPTPPGTDVGRLGR